MAWLASYVNQTRSRGRAGGFSDTRPGVPNVVKAAAKKISARSSWLIHG